MFLIGGSNPIDHAEQYTDVEQYDVQLDKWTDFPKLNVSREKASSCSLENHLYVFCGYNSALGLLNSIESFNIKAYHSGVQVTWETIPII